MRTTMDQAFPPFSQSEWEDLNHFRQQFLDQLERQIPMPPPNSLVEPCRQLSSIYNALSDGGAAGRNDLLPARLHFFMPTDMVKVWLPLQEIRHSFDFTKRKRLEVLDLGAGVGTATAGIVSYLAMTGFKGNVRFTLVEPDRVVLRTVPSIMAALDGIGKVKFQFETRLMSVEEFLQKREDGRFDLAVLLNVLSELFPPQDYVSGVARLARQLLSTRIKKTGFLIMVEPALKKTSRVLYQAAQALREGGQSIYAPCLAREGYCASLSKNDFCFHCLPVALSPPLQSVSSRAGLDRHEVNFAYLTLSPAGVRYARPDDLEQTTLGRVVSFPKRVQKGFFYRICTPDGLVSAWVPRNLPDSDMKGGKLLHGTLVRLGGSPPASRDDSEGDGDKGDEPPTHTLFDEEDRGGR